MEEQGLADRRIIVRVKARIADGVPGPGLWESGFGEVRQTRPACGVEESRLIVVEIENENLSSSS